MFASHSTLIVLVFVHALATDRIQNPLSDEFINLINSKQNSWIAGRNFPPDTPLSRLKLLAGAVRDDDFILKLPKVKHDSGVIANLPETFDARDKWPNCPSLNEIRDQGGCGSCWAFGPVEVMTDRYCIFSNGTKNFHFSAQDVMSCCSKHDYVGSCFGGSPTSAWTYWNTTGIVSGGNYNSSQGCRPYEIPPCDHYLLGSLPPCHLVHQTPECKESCISSYNIDYHKDKHYPKKIYGLHYGEEYIQADLFLNGPIETSFKVYSDFFDYKKGVYKHVEGLNDEHYGFHVVKFMGWGVENGTKYWLIANSWNSGWGENGFFKILRGEDHCGIEDVPTACVPHIV